MNSKDFKSNIYIYMLLYKVYLYTYIHFIKNQLYFIQKHSQVCALTKNVNAISKLNNSKTTKDQLKVEQNNSNK